MKRILLPVDFSLPATQALEYALPFAADTGAHLILAYVYPMPTIEMDMPFFAQEQLLKVEEKGANEAMNAFVAQIPVAARAKITLETQVVMGFPVDEIERLCQVHKPDLVIMGMRGGNHLAKKILGTTTTRVIQRITEPVLVIPENATYQGIREIAYATDFDQEDIAAIDQMLNLAKRYQAKVHCIHISQNGSVEDDYKQAILKEAYRYDFSMHPISFDLFSYEGVVSGLNVYVKKNKIDLLAMLTHKRGLFGRLFHQSDTYNMALQTEVPIWVFHAPSRSQSDSFPYLKDAK